MHLRCDAAPHSTTNTDVLVKLKYISVALLCAPVNVSLECRIFFANAGKPTVCPVYNLLGLHEYAFYHRFATA